MYDYSYGELRAAYKNIGVKNGGLVYVTGNFGRLGRYEEPGKQALLKAHYEVLTELLGDCGTLVVPTHSFSYANTDKIFSLEKTPSETGPFTEFVRNQPGSIRQVHPFSSSTAVGALAEKICGNSPKHVYGWGSPFFYLVENNALHISVGKEVNKTISLVHHAEFMMGVPYRYTKEFSVNVEIDGVVNNDNYYLHVLYKNADIVRDKNELIIRSFGEENINKVALGRSFIQSVSINKLYQHTVSLLTENIYIWLKHPPTIRPYRK